MQATVHGVTKSRIRLSDFTFTSLQPHYHIQRIARLGVGRETDLVMVAYVNGEGNGTPLQYSCLENPMAGGAWWAAVRGVAKSWTRLSEFTFLPYCR